jgi:hypothetical protein
MARWELSSSRGLISDVDCTLGLGLQEDTQSRTSNAAEKVGGNPLRFDTPSPSMIALTHVAPDAFAQSPTTVTGWHSSPAMSRWAG